MLNLTSLIKIKIVRNYCYDVRDWGCIMTRGGARADSVWLLLFCFSYSHTSGVGNNSSNSSGAGISSSIPSSVPLQPSAPPQINVIAATPNIEKKQARVLYDYDAADSSELTLLADEVRHHLALIFIWVACFGNKFFVDSVLVI